MTQIFISYSRKDLTFVELLAKDLRSAGFEVWYDLSNLVVGANWGKEIQTALRNSQYLIVVLSPSSVDSEWVEREYLYASNLKLKIIPILYKDCELPLWSLNIHHIDMANSNYAKTLENLLKVMGGPQNQQTAPKAEPVPEGLPQKGQPVQAGSWHEPGQSGKRPEARAKPGHAQPPPRKGAGKTLAIVAGILAVLGGGYLLGRTFLPGILGVQPAATQTSPAASIPLVTQPTRQPTTQPTNTPYYSWEQINDGGFLPRDPVIFILPDPVNEQVIYAATENSGLFKSINGGKSWESIQDGLDRAVVFNLLIDPQNPQTLYAATRGSGHLYKSVNGGQSWQAIQPKELVDFRETLCIAMDPGDPAHLFLGYMASVYESSDGGTNWEKVGNDTNWGFQGLVVASPGGRKLFALGGEETGWRFNVSEDFGVTWTGTNWFEPFYNNMLVENTLGGGQNIYLWNTQDRAIQVSSDEGATWRKSPQPCSGMALDPHGGLVASCEDGIVRTRDGGETWEVVNGEIDNFDAISVSPHSTETLYGSMDGFSISTDGGRTWTASSEGLGDVRSELTAGASLDALYIEDWYGSLHRSRDNGISWEKIWGSGFGFAIGSEGELWRGEPDYLFKSSDQGDSWDQINLPQQSSDGPDYTISAHPLENGLVYLVYPEPGRIFRCPGGAASCEEYPFQWPEGSGNDNTNLWEAHLFFGSNEIVYMVSRDGTFFSVNSGQNWESCFQDGWHFIWPSGGKHRLVIDPRDNDTVFLATLGKGVNRSGSRCGLWWPRSTGLGNLFVNSLAMDAFNPDLLYAGTEGGAYATFDGGAHWVTINDGLGVTNVVYSITVDESGEVYASTPDGIFRLVR